MSRKKCQNNEKTFGGRLRLFRNSMGLNIVELSNLLVISHSSLSQVENNKTITSSQTISNLVQKTNINIYWLFTGEGEMTRGENNASIYKVEKPDADPETQALLNNTLEVLTSETDYAKVLSASIRGAYNAVKTEKRLNGLEARIEKMEKDGGVVKGRHCMAQDQADLSAGDVTCDTGT